jgi:hypothetical protein
VDMLLLVFLRRQIFYKLHCFLYYEEMLPRYVVKRSSSLLLTDVQ